MVRLVSPDGEALDVPDDVLLADALAGPSAPPQQREFQAGQDVKYIGPELGCPPWPGMLGVVVGPGTEPGTTRVQFDLNAGLIIDCCLSSSDSAGSQESRKRCIIS